MEDFCIIEDQVDHIKWIDDQYPSTREMKDMLVCCLGHLEDIEVLVEQTDGPCSPHKVSIWQGAREWSELEIKELYDEIWKDSERDNWYSSLEY